MRRLGPPLSALPTEYLDAIALDTVEDASGRVWLLAAVLMDSSGLNARLNRNVDAINAAKQAVDFMDQLVKSAQAGEKLKWQREKAAALGLLSDVYATQDGGIPKAIEIQDERQKITDLLVRTDPMNTVWQAENAWALLRLANLEKVANPASCRSHFDAAKVIVMEMEQAGQPLSTNQKMLKDWIERCESELAP